MFDDFQADYQLVAASQTAKVLAGQGAGKVGDILRTLTIIPLALGAGDVSIIDGDGVAMKVFATGTLADLSPVTLHIHARSVSGPWKVTTGASVQVFATGRFQ